MPETESAAFGSAQEMADAAKNDVEWAQGKPIETTEARIGLHEHLDQDKFKPELLLDSLEKAQDGWDKSGNLVKIVNYKDANYQEGQALQAIFQIRQHTYNKELEKAQNAVEKLNQTQNEGTQEHIGCQLWSKTVIGSSPANLEAKSGGVQMFLDGSKRVKVEGDAAKDLPQALLGIQFTDRGLFAVSLTDEAAMTIHYTNRRDGSDHFVPIPREQGGTADEDEMFQLNRNALPGQTWIEINTQNGQNYRLVESGVIANKSFRDWLAGRPSTIKEIQWKLEPVETTTAETSAAARVAPAEPPRPVADSETEAEMTPQASQSSVASEHREESASSKNIREISLASVFEVDFETFREIRIGHNPFIANGENNVEGIRVPVKGGLPPRTLLALSRNDDGEVEVVAANSKHPYATFVYKDGNQNAPHTVNFERGGRPDAAQWQAFLDTGYWQGAHFEIRPFNTGKSGLIYALRVANAEYNGGRITKMRLQMTAQRQEA